MKKWITELHGIMDMLRNSTSHRREDIESAEQRCLRMYPVEEESTETPRDLLDWVNQQQWMADDTLQPIAVAIESMTKTWEREENISSFRWRDVLFWVLMALLMRKLSQFLFFLE